MRENTRTDTRLRRLTVKDTRLAAAAIVVVALATLAAQTQNPPAQQPKPTADPYANNPQSGRGEVSARRARRQGQRRDGHAARRRGEPGPVRSGDLEVRHRVQPAAGREDLESGEAEDDAGRQGDRRHALQRDRSGDLLRDGERRLRLHLDRDAARPARLGGGGAHVAHVSAREGRARRRASPTPTSARFSTRSTPARW